MRLGIGFGAERLGCLALKFPRMAAAVLLGLLAVIALCLPRISFEDDVLRVFLSDSELSQAQRAYDAAQDPPLTNVLVHLTADVAFTTDQIMALRDLTLDLEFVAGVTAVASPFALRMPPSDVAPNGTPLFGPQITPTYADDLATFTDLGTGLPTFINDARTAMLLAVSVSEDDTTITEAIAAIMAEVARTLPDDVTANLTGEDVISAEIVAGLKVDLVALNLWGALIITLAAFALLRDLRMALLAVGPALFGAAAVLALSVLLGFPITVLSNVIPILLLVLGVADGVHLAGHLKDGGTPEDAVRLVGPACALTALTTAVAFSSVSLTGNAQLFEFAVLGALGTLLSFAIVITTFPLLARSIAVSAKPVPQISGLFAQALVRWGAARPKVTVALFAGLLAIATLGFIQTTAWFPLYNNLPGSSDTGATNDAISEDFGGVFQLVIETSDWATTREVALSLEALSGPQTVLSEVNLARWLGDGTRAPTSEDLARLPEDLVGQLRPEDGLSRIFVSMAEPMRSAESLARFDVIHDAAITAGADRIIGLPAVMRAEAVRLINQLSLGLTLAALGATALVALAFRSVRLVPILLIPNVLPLMVTGASLHLWAQGHLSPTAVLALTIAFGIAIDDTVHFLNRFANARAAGEAASQAVISAGRSAGQVMVLTTLLLTAGLSVTVFSDYFPIRLFGGMMIVTLWAALLIDLLLLPALLSRRGRSDDPA